MKRHIFTHSITNIVLVFALLMPDLQLGGLLGLLQGLGQGVAQAMDLPDLVLPTATAVDDSEEQPTATPTAGIQPGMVTPSPQPQSSTDESSPGQQAQSNADDSITRTMNSASGTTWVLVGDADDTTVPGAIKLTDDHEWSRGAAWAIEEIDLTKNFDISFLVYLGDDDDPPYHGADGIAFALQNVGTDAIGQYGGGFGYQTITPSIAVEIDTYYNVEHNDPDLYGGLDHMGIDLNGDVDHDGLQVRTFDGGNIEDMEEHWLRVVWDAQASTLHVYWEGALILTYSDDIVENIFDGDSTVWYGLTGATLAGYNLQYFKETSKTVPNAGVYSSCDDLCFNDAYQDTQGYTGGPINTRTGGYDYSVEDLSISTLAGQLSFRRYYSSLTVDEYSSVLGYGWTHNHDLHLTFGPYQDGMRDIIFKGPSSNQYRFIDGGDVDTFTPYPGVFASLEKVYNYNPDWVKYIVTDRMQRKFIFDQDGNILSYTDPVGHTLEYQYDNQERLYKVSDETGRYILLDYQGNSPRIISVSDHTGRHVDFSYENDNLTGVTDVLGQTWSYEYIDPLYPHHLNYIRDPLGRTVEYTRYDELGRAIHQEQGLWYLTTELFYNSDGTTIITDSLENVTTHTYDERNTITGLSGPLDDMTDKTYDGNFRPITVTTSGHTLNMTWSANGMNLLQVEDPDGGLTTNTYDALNNLTSTIDSRGFTTTHIYSGTLLTSTIYALGSGIFYTTTYIYTTAADGVPPGLLKEMEDAQGNHTWYGYNGHGERIVMTDTLGRDTHYDYDSLGRLTTTTYPSGREDWTCYDTAGRVIRSVANAKGAGDPCDEGYIPDPDPRYNRITETVYDVRGNPIITTDPNGLVTRTYYDQADRAVRIVRNLKDYDPLLPDPPPDELIGVDSNLTTSFVYYRYDNRIATYESKRVGDQVVRYWTRTYFDALNRPVAVVQNLFGRAEWDETLPTREFCDNTGEPDQNVCSWTNYYPDLSMTETIDNAGRKTAYCYDSKNRIVKSVQNPSVQNPCTDYSPSGEPDEDIINRTVYDANDNAIAVIDPLGMVTRTYYDGLDRPYLVVRNLTGWDYTEKNPPPETAFGNDENVATGTRYNANSNAIASVEWLLEGTQVISHTTRTYYDELSRPYLVVRNLTCQDYRVETPPAENCFGNEYNVATGTTFDEDGRAIASVEWLVEGTQVISHTTRTYYDVLDRPIAVVRNFMGNVSSPTWPNFDTSFPDQNVRTEYRYDAKGNQIATLEVLAEDQFLVTRTYYDVLSRAYAVVRNLVVRVNGVPLPVEDAIAQATPPVYDPDYPDENARTDTVFDGRGHSIASVEWSVVEGVAITQTTRTYYDGINRPITVVQNLTPTWDVLDPLAPECNRDASGTQEPYNICNETLYNQAGEAIATIDPLGRVTRTYYDQLYRPTAIVKNLTGDPYASAPPPYDPDFPDQNVRTERSYDANGNQVAAVDVLSETLQITTTFEYNELGRLAAVVENYQPGLPAGPETNVRTEYLYDALGNRLVITDANSHATTFTYDALDRLHSQSDPLNNTWALHLRSDGQPHQRNCSGWVSDLFRL